MRSVSRLALMVLVAVSATILFGCGEPNLAQESDAYKKLPPGEGQRRLQETLAKHSGKIPQSATPKTPGQ